MTLRLRVAELLRWIARISTVVIIALILLMATVPAGSPTPNQWIGLVFFPVLVVIGLLIAWRREALGALLATLGLVAFYGWSALGGGHFARGPWFLVCWSPALFFFSSWLLRRGESVLTASLLILSVGFGGRSDLRAQQHAQSPYLTIGLFIGAIEEGARIFTPARLLPFNHPEAQGHEFPTVQQLHRGEDQLLVILGQAAGLQLGPTLQRYPTEPDSAWPYAPFLPPPVDRFRSAAVITRAIQDVPLPGLRAVALLDGSPIAFLVDTRGLSLAARHMQRPTTMGLDITRADLLTALSRAAQLAPPAGATIIVYDR